MRKIGLSLLFLLSALTIASVSILQTQFEDPPNDTITPTIVNTEVLGLPSSNKDPIIELISYNESDLKAIILTEINEESIQLFSNLEESKTSTEIMSSNACNEIINGGFYTLQNTHPGLFISNYEELHSYIRNETFDGIFSINDLDTPRITRSIPSDKLRIGLQTGPILIENSNVLDISIKNDKLARRSILAITGENEMIFITLYNKNSVFMGPYLSDVPEIVDILSAKLNLEIADAVNLDGGSASTIHAKNFSLPEASIIGSYFCM